MMGLVSKQTMDAAEAAYKTAIKEWLDACRVVDDARKAACDAVANRKTAPAVVMDVFGGAGTAGLVADRLQRDAVLIELNPEYAAMAERRIVNEAGMLAKVTVETMAKDAAE